MIKVGMRIISRLIGNSRISLILSKQMKLMKKCKIIMIKWIKTL